MKKYFLNLIFISLLSSTAFANKPTSFTLESSAFKTHSMIPAKFTCKGQDISPPLVWNYVPPNTKSLALVVDDPNAPSGSWTHWAMFNIPPTVTHLDVGAAVPDGATVLNNSWGTANYRGPCPNMGAHSYSFKLYALDKILDLNSNASKDDLLNAMTGYVLGTAELMGIYQNPTAAQ